MTRHYLSLMLITSLLSGLLTVAETDEEELDDIEAEEIMLAILGHVSKKDPNKANVRNGASDSALEFMSSLYKDISLHDTSHNETKVEVDFFGETLPYYEDDGSKRGKRETKDMADTAITFITESRFFFISLFFTHFKID